MDNLADLMPFSKLMGINVTHADETAVRAQLVVRPDLCTTGGIMHGGAIMALADTLGGVGAFMTLPEGAKATTTVESKTNFLGPAPEGTTITAEAVPVKLGRRLSMWATTITGEDGRIVAYVTQSQMVL